MNHPIHRSWTETYGTTKEKNMNSSKHKFIARIVWTRKGVENFEKAVNELIDRGWEPGGIEISRGVLRTVCMAMLHKPPEKCECECPCCLEMHQGSCS